MFCTNCGNQYDETRDVVCTNCGSEVQGVNNSPVMQQPLPMQPPQYQPPPVPPQQAWQQPPPPPPIPQQQMQQSPYQPPPVPPQHPQQYQQPGQYQQPYNPANMNVGISPKNKTIMMILSIFGFHLGLQYFYAGLTKKALLMLILYWPCMVIGWVFFLIGGFFLVIVQALLVVMAVKDFLKLLKGEMLDSDGLRIVD